MAILSVTNISAALKDFYLEGLRTQINEETDPFWAEMEKSTRLVSGEDIVLSLRYGRSGGVGARADDGDLPTANARKSKKATFQTKNVFGRMQITTKSIETSKSNQGAFVNMLEQTLDDLLTDVSDYVEFQAYGDGTGKIATLASVAAAVTTITLDSVVGLAEGMLVDVIGGGTGEVAGSVKHSALEITDVDDENNQITVSSAVTAGTDDYLVHSGSYGLEMTGLSKIFTSDNTLYGIDRSANSFFNPTRVNVAGDISDVQIQKGLDRAFTKTGTKHDFLIGSHGVHRAWQLYKEGQRSLVNTVQLKGGWEAPVYQNGRGQAIPFIAAKYAPSGKLRAISRKNFEVAWLSDFNWLDQDGAILSRVAGKAAYEATMQLFADLCCDVPAGQVEFYGITEY